MDESQDQQVNKTNKLKPSQIHSIKSNPIQVKPKGEIKQKWN